MNKKENEKLIRKINQGSYYYLDCYKRYSKKRRKLECLLKDIELFNGSMIDNQEHSKIIDDTLKEVRRIIRATAQRGIDKND